MRIVLGYSELCTLLDGKGQFIASRDILDDDVMFFDSRRQQRFACARYKSGDDLCVPSSMHYSYAKARALVEDKTLANGGQWN